jgi:hypothetical protein
LPSMAAYDNNNSLRNIWPTLGHISNPYDNQWKSIDGGPIDIRRMCVCVVLRSRAVSLYLVNAEYGHFGALKTAMLIFWDSHCAALGWEI